MEAAAAVPEEAELDLHLTTPLLDWSYEQRRLCQLSDDPKIPVLHESDHSAGGMLGGKTTIGLVPKDRDPTTIASVDEVPNFRASLCNVSTV